VVIARFTFGLLALSPHWSAKSQSDFDPSPQRISL
jgi:hypothetical protein